MTDCARTELTIARDPATANAPVNHFMFCFISRSV
jgi:hypothetical protein